MSSLDDRLDYDAEAWKPEPGDKLVGEIVDMSETESEWGAYTIYEVRQDDGTVLAWHAYHGVPKKELAKMQPSIGDRLGVRYKGKVKTKPGSKYESYEGYKIKLERANGTVPDAPNWDAQANDADTELSGTEYPATTVDGDGDPF